ncbi:MAG: DUF2127 domain-containing protein [Rhodanobacteraceae bacterium]|nr:MAG: DUF2127 domain-containing protein [Rhodanobacteraceae bacterium]
MRFRFVFGDQYPHGAGIPVQEALLRSGVIGGFELAIGNAESGLMVKADRLVHRAFLVGMIFKGADGFLELIGAIALFVTTRPEIQHMVAWLAREELAEDPTDFFATHAVNMAQHLTAGTQHFAAAYLLVHGVIKLALVAGLLRGLRWVFPVALVVLTAFIGYQLYRLAHFPSLALGLFTLLDVIVVVLVGREWRTRENHAPRQGWMLNSPGKRRPKSRCPRGSRTR